jgi:uncharacterized protein
MVARRDIKKGEEITYDYATTEANDTKGITNCICKTNLCRKNITKDDWKLKELRERYDGHFLNYIQEMIKEENN